jgi:hypothetical protein
MAHEVAGDGESERLGHGLKERFWTGLSLFPETAGGDRLQGGEEVLKGGLRRRAFELLGEIEELIGGPSWVIDFIGVGAVSGRSRSFRRLTAARGQPSHLLEELSDRSCVLGKEHEGATDC